MPSGTPFLQTPYGRRFVRSRWQHLLLALGFVLVVLLLGSTHWQATAGLNALGYLQRQAERVEHLDDLLIQLMDAENAVRGYLLSGNRAHLEPYDRVSETAQRTLDAIRLDLDSNRDNDAALADLSGLVAIKLRSLDEAVDKGIPGADTRLQGKRYTDRIRDRILGLKQQLAAEGHLSYERSTSNMQDSRWVIAALAACALSLMTILFLVLERQLRLREQIAGMLQSENQRLDMLVQERTAELSELASYLTDVREAEKASLARELHDELGALLTTAKMEAGWLTRRLDGAEEPLLDHLKRLEQLLDGGIALKRRIIDDLRPPLLEMLGLVSALRALAEDFAHDSEETLSLDLPAADVTIPPAPALACYRIAQEALTNIRKHAHARQVALALRVTATHLELDIKDDGIGLRTGGNRGRHHGLGGMKHRVQMCNGEFSLASRPGEGTRILAHIPLAALSPAPVLADQDRLACST
jgi:protein-histidine pros-kinase